MPGLADIYRIKKQVPVPYMNGDGQVHTRNMEVGGISAATIAKLLGKYPEIRAMFDEARPGAGAPEMTFDKLLVMVPDAGAEILASGTGESAEECAQLPLEVQVDLIVAIAEVTMPSGVGPFVAKIRRLVGGFTPNRLPVAAQPQTAQATELPSQSSS